MKLILPTTIQKLLPFLRKPRDKFRSDDVIWTGLVTLAIFFTALVLWSGYFFYSRVYIQPDSDYETSIRRAVRVDVKDVNEIIGILNERQKKFDEILGQ
ncbi:MAG: hypothetical protein A3C07_01375 [Candidatus Sungbacteria bacterium RIFCSPHIGHO2_02_FULL_47_11]|uniref:Uncharacterized protein n=1 Tax=Candidatus Sungbacteria bacterium RIFCSPHIGHO2_02_FULL_47_11 TaxID=1802270 RepID=A0A1G2KPX3_9BACT|nr:MAG: hypothetical protein A3C07_01375 [Candidatus Sungbacteria bacterium RIFCSPHIGHO2_02_FULL_47_11]